MPTYIVLANWTSQGIGSIKDAPARLDAAKQAAKAAGGEIKAFYLVMGRYDFVTIIEPPSEQRVATQLLPPCAQGNARTETLRAFNEEEYRKIVASLP